MKLIFSFFLVCTKSFYLFEDYNRHLQQESDSTVDNVKIHSLCEELTTLQNQMNEDVFEFGRYKCLYCEDGFNDKGEKEF